MTARKEGPKAKKEKCTMMFARQLHQSTYEAGATLAHWNRQELEQQPPNG